MAVPNGSTVDELIFELLDEDQRKVAFGKLFSRVEEQSSDIGSAVTLQSLSRLLALYPDKTHIGRLRALLDAHISRHPSDVHVIWQCLGANRHLADSFFDGIVEVIRIWLCSIDERDGRFEVNINDFLQAYMPQANLVRGEDDCRTNPNPSSDSITKNMTVVRDLLKKGRSIQLDRHLLHHLYTISLCLTASRSTSLAIVAREASVAILNLTTVREEDDPFGMPIVCAITWVWMRTLKQGTSARPYSTTTSRLWFQWISRLVDSEYVPKTLFDGQYWRMLNQCLASGNSEERKFYLSILISSIRLLDRDLAVPDMLFIAANKTTYHVEYQKYCVLLQTIALDRYQNQVEECMSDLESIICGDIIHSSWLETLLSAVLEGDVQDTIRNPNGRWYMQLCIRRPRELLKLVKIHAGPFLNWANTGTLWSHSAARVDLQVICPHGEDLRLLHQRLLENCPTATGARALVHAVLSWAEIRRDHMYPFMLPFVLGGFAAAKRPDRFLEPDDIEQLCQLALTGGHRDLVRALMVAHCMALAHMCDWPPSYYVHNWPGFQRAKAYHAQLVQGIVSLHDRSRTAAVWPSTVPGASGHEDAKLQNDSLSSLHQMIIASRHRCLLGQGLLHFCKAFSTACNTDVVNEENYDFLKTIFEAVWDETEIQDYPKEVMMALPSLLLQARWLSFAHACNDGTWIQTTNHTLSSLYKFADNRIYMLYPVISSIREVMASDPSLSSPIIFRSILVRFAYESPQPRSEYLLEALLAEDLNRRVPSISYSTFNGPRESAGYAGVFDLVNKLNDNRYRPFASSLFDDLLLPWATQKPSATIVSKWKRTEAVQMLVILSETCQANAPTDAAEQCLNTYFSILALEPLPRFRYLFEWMILRLYLHHPSLRASALQNVKEHNNPRHAASLVKVALKVACFPDSEEGYASDLLTLLIPLCASGKVAIRHEAQWCIPDLWDHCQQRHWLNLLNNQAFGALNTFVRNIDKYASSLSARKAESFDPIKDHSLSNLFLGPHMDMYPPATRIVSAVDFENLRAKDTLIAHLSNLPKSVMPLGTVASSALATTISSPDVTKLGRSADAIVSTSIPLQTKGGSFSHPSLDATSDRASHPLILCGSLIDNPYNLGGLSRAAEIFAASSLLLPSFSYTSSTQFTSVAVTSHLHLPLAELTPPDTPAYLAERKSEGYTIIGVEQTDQSVILGTEACVLPRKCVLVMGSEKGGIPGNVLMECDMCVEIRQEGRTRSLNVQTAASVVLYEYQRQWAGKDVK